MPINLEQQQHRQQQIAKYAVKKALELGADESSVTVRGASGIAVSAHDGQPESLEYNQDQGLQITVYSSQRQGNASTTDLSTAAVDACIEAALSIAQYADQDPCAGIAPEEWLCHEFKDLNLVQGLVESPQQAVSEVLDLEQQAQSLKHPQIKASDGSSLSSFLSYTTMANSHDFCHCWQSSINNIDVSLIGQSNGQMEHGFGYSVSRDFKQLQSHQEVLAEALEKTLDKLDSKPIASTSLPIIFKDGAAQSLWGALIGAISGGAIFRKTSFLCDALKTQILPDFINIYEDPWVLGGLSSRCCDAQGVACRPDYIVRQGLLEQYLLGVYSARKLKLQANGHGDVGVHNCFVSADEAHTRDFADLLEDTGEGIVVTSLMGQGVDLTSGNYSRGARGFYFKQGKKQHAVSEITIAGNLKQMFKDIRLLGNDVDKRHPLLTGSVLIEGMTISGN